MWILFILFLIPFIVYILNVKHYKFQNFLYFFKFLFFNVIVLCYSIIYLLYYIIYFVFKNYRFFSYYYQIARVSKFYYNKKSIYFLFWKYLTIYLIANIYNIIIFLLYNIIIFFKKYFYINNVFLIVLINSKLLLFSDAIKNLIYLLYNCLLLLCYHFFNFININWIYVFTKRINILNRWNNIQDPFLKRNTYIKLIDFFNYWILQKNNKNLFYVHLVTLKFLLKKFILSYIFVIIHNWDAKKFHKIVLNIWIMQKFQLSQSTKLLNTILLWMFYLNVLFINFIYILLMLILNAFHIILNSLWKYRIYFIYFIILILCIKYYWCVHYYFLVLYKHYTLYLPVFEVKESFRFFNFEWIDMSNYYDLVLFRNTLIDASVFNNSIYNDLLNNLSQTLSLYGFKITPKYNIAMYSALKDIYNKDTDLLNNMFKFFNENKSYNKYKWYIRMRKIFNNKLKSVYHYYKPKKGLTRREKRLGEYLYNRININTKAPDTRHLIEKKFPMTQEIKNKLGIYNFYTKGYYRKKISKKFVMLNLGHFLKIKKIPLRYTSIHSTDYTDQRLIFLFKWLKENTEKYKFIRSFHRKFKFGVNSLKKLVCSHDYKFFLGQFYSFGDYGINSKYMVYKHKIPTFNWTIARWKRRVPNKSTVDFIYTATIDTEHPFMTYRDVPKKKVFLKRNFKMRFIYTHYPYAINQYYDIERMVNYFSVINNLKIVKKYYYIYNTKLYFNKKYYTITLESNRVFIKQFLYRLSLIKKPFNKLHFFKSKKNLKTNTNFWFFFDYMKTNKYFHHKYSSIYGDQHYVNFYFIKRTRKGYIKLRNDLIRMYSLYFYYRNFERAMYKNWWPDTLSTFEQNLRNQDRFDSLRTAWFTYSYLTNDRTNVKLLKNIRILNYLFRENFMSYHIYCDHNINYPNIGYHEQIDTYKLKVLNKINNLKRFFYFQNKRNSGWSIFKYLNVFSVKYHIKHFLWHNPYSFLIYKNKFLYKVKDYNLNYIFLYTSNNEIVECSKYSLIFNFYLNIFEINNDILNMHLNKDFIYNELKNYYSFGISNYYNSSDFEIYRIIMNFILYYYKNFIYRLVRYRYILDYKNYTLLKFIKRYFNIVDWFYHSYFRFRWLIHKYIFFGNFIKKAYYKFFQFRYIYSYRVRRLAFLPFWFYFDNFTKVFMYIVLNKFYIKSNFIFYWFYVNYNFTLISICIYFYNFKFWLLNHSINTMMLNHLWIRLKNFEIDYKAFKNELLYFNNIFNFNFTNDTIQNFIIIFEALFININDLYNNSLNLFEFNFYKMLLRIHQMVKNVYVYFTSIISKIWLSDSLIYVKWYISIILKSYNIIWLNIIYAHVNSLLKLYYFNFNVKILFKLNNLIYIKYYVSKLLLYYVKILFNLNNTLVYFKPNYYNFRQQRNLRYTKKFKVYFKSNFVSTRTVRSIYSFKHYTDNMVFLKNISFFNIYNYLYLMNSYDINLLNISTNLFIVFKNQSIIYIILIYFFLYIFIFILLFIMYRKFYNIYFFCRIINNDLQDHWDKKLNNSTKNLLKKVTKMKLKYFNFIFKHKKAQNFYNFFSFNLLMYKKDLTQQFLFKIFIKSKFHNKIKEKFNNNYIINIKNTKFLLDFSTVLYKIYDFMKFANVKHYNVTKEKKTFNIYFYNLLNSNIFNLCFLYWVILIPYFFLEYIWMRYHLKGHIRIKRRYFLLLKVCLNNFKFYVQLSKLIGLNNYYTSHKRKLPRNYLNGSRYRRKRKLKFGFFFKWDRFNNTLVRLSSLGNYFYWFSHINKWEYFLSYKKYFFNFSYNSNYFYFIYIYIIFLVVKLWNYKKYNRCRI